jgi:hypothetical protein
MIDKRFDSTAGFPAEQEVELPEELDSLLSGVDSGESVITMTEDGGAIIEEAMAEINDAMLAEHDANLAEFMEEDELNKLAMELIEAVEADENSREEWVNTTAKGLKLLGLQIEERTEPWKGACGVTHPLLAMAAVRFNSRAINELFPAGSPVKCKPVGRRTVELDQQADRVADYYNYALQHEMLEYFDEHDKLLWVLPTVGCAFKKVYYDHTTGRAMCEYVPAEDFVVAYHTKSLESSGRYTHVLRMTHNDVRRNQLSGFFLDVDLGEPTEANGTKNAVIEEKEETEGRGPSFREGDDRHTLFEVSVELDLAGFEDVDDEGEPTGLALPYIVTIDRDSQKVLAVRRNWRETDPSRRKRSHFVKYGFIPGFGFYDLGFIQILGGIVSASTSILRQLVDAGTLANLPAGFKARGLRVDGGDEPLAPGEFRDVDAPGLDLDKAIKMLPYKGADASLVAMLDKLVEWGERLAQTTDMQIDNLNKEVPVGTIMALLEENNDVRSAIMRRLHVAQHNEYRLLGEVFSEYLPDEYPFDVNGAPRTIFKQDFDQRVDVLPVSDPRTYSRSQRLIIAQTKLQIAQQAPQLHDMREVYREFYDAMGVDDIERIMPPPQQAFTGDPVSENTIWMKGTPIAASIQQNHQAHIMAHMGFLQMAAMNPATAQTVQQLAPAMQAHLAEHFAMNYQITIAQMAGIPVEMLTSGQQLPPEIEGQVAVAAAKATQQMAAQMQQAAAGAAGAADGGAAMMLAQSEMAEVDRKRLEDERKHARETQKLMIEAAKIEGDQAIKGAEVMLKAQQQQVDQITTANEHLERIRDQEIQETQSRLQAQQPQQQKPTAAPQPAAPPVGVPRS